MSEGNGFNFEGTIRSRGYTTDGIIQNVQIYKDGEYDIFALLCFIGYSTFKIV